MRDTISKKVFHLPSSSVSAECPETKFLATGSSFASYESESVFGFHIENWKTTKAIPKSFLQAVCGDDGCNK